MLDTGCEVHPVMVNPLFTFSNPTQEFQITTKHRSAAVIFIAFIEFYPLYIMIMLIINIEHHLTTHIFSSIDADYPWSLNLGLGRIGIHSDDWHPTFPLADVLTLTSIYWWRIPTSWYLRIRLLTSTMTFNLALSRPTLDDCISCVRLWINFSWISMNEPFIWEWMPSLQLYNNVQNVLW